MGKEKRERERQGKIGNGKEELITSNRFNVSLTSCAGGSRVSRIDQSMRSGKENYRGSRRRWLVWIASAALVETFDCAVRCGMGPA